MRFWELLAHTEHYVVAGPNSHPPVHPLIQKITISYVFEDHHHLVDAPCHVCSIASLTSAGGEDDGISSTLSGPPGPKSNPSQLKLGAGTLVRCRIHKELVPGVVDRVENGKAGKKPYREVGESER